MPSPTDLTSDADDADDDTIVDQQEAADAAAAIEAFNKSFEAHSVNSAASTVSDDETVDLTDAAASPAAAPAPAPTPRKPKAKKTDGDGEAGEGGDGAGKDPFADADPHVKRLYATMLADRQRIRTAEGKTALLESQLAKLRNQLGNPAAAASQSGNVSTAPAAAPAPSSKRREALERVRGEMPEVAEALDEALGEIDKLRGDPAAGAAAAPAAAPAPAAAKRDPAVEAVTRLDPNWAQKVNSEEWDLWLTTQPEDVQARLMNTENPLELAIGLKDYDAYRASHAPAGGASRTPAPPPARRNDVQARRDQRAAAAAAPPASGGRAPANREMTVDEAFEAGFARVASGKDR